MDSVILSLAIKLYKKLISFITDLQSDFYGTGEMGNCIVTADEDKVELGWTQLVPQQTITEQNEVKKYIYQLPISLSTQFNNLIIDDKVLFTTTPGVPYLFLYVRDTLTIRQSASLSMNNRGANSSNFAPFLPQPSQGSSPNPYTTACLRMFVSGRDIRNTYDLSCYGGDINSTSGLSGGGSSGAGGGLLALYYKGNISALEYDIDTGEEIPSSSDVTSMIHCNGGSGPDGITNENKGGGMLFIFAKNIKIDTTASISCDGGNGNGKTSFWRSAPTQGDDTSTGGGGVVVDVPMRVE